MIDFSAFDNFVSFVTTYIEIGFLVGSFEHNLSTFDNKVYVSTSAKSTKCKVYREGIYQLHQDIYNLPKEYKVKIPFFDNDSLMGHIVCHLIPCSVVQYSKNLILFSAPFE